MKRLLTLLWFAALTSALFSLRVTDMYKSGDTYDFAIESAGKVVGSQHAECKGWQVIGADSLMFFEMDTKSVFAHGGNTFDMDVTCQVGYLPVGLAKTYKYTLTLLNTKVEHSGELMATGYSGRTIRMGVTQPVSYDTKQWPLLFDNNFALQWEIALRPLRLKPRDSASAPTVIPQLNQAAIFKFYDAPDERIMFDGQEMSVRGVKIDPANQILYFDQSGRLLKAVDIVQMITIRRLPAGETAEIAREAWFDTFMERLPVYGLLLAFAVVWLLALAYRNIKRVDMAILFVAGSALYWLSLQLLTPLQNAYFGVAFDPKGGNTNIYLVLLGSAFLFALVEELTKFVSMLARLLLGLGHNPRLGIALGAACGAGFAMMQVTNLVSFTPSGGVAIPADLIQKFFLISLNAATGGLIGFLLVSRLAGAYYLIPIGLKTLVNWLTIFVQKGAMRLPMYSFLTFVVAALALGVLYLLYRRMVSSRPLPSSGKHK